MDEKKSSVEVRKVRGPAEANNALIGSVVNGGTYKVHPEIAAALVPHRGGTEYSEFELVDEGDAALIDALRPSLQSAGDAPMGEAQDVGASTESIIT